MKARSAFLAGARDALPLILGGLPFGVLYGALATGSGLPPVVSQSMSLIVFAGSAQVIAVPLLAANAPAFVVIGIFLIVNLRHALYSAAIAPYTRSLGRAVRMLMAYFLVDEVFALAIARYQRDGDTKSAHAYYFGCAVAICLYWQLASAVGIFIGGQLPANWPLDFAMPLMFIALAVPMIKDRPGLLAAVVAGLLAVALAGLPYKLGLVLATLIGVGAGMLGSSAWTKH
ncbi:MAG: AzlC family ABC transporter permease [Chloroflexi bacterium]|nr:AzlC family ABC transporter permease [Chloroflexota bacterium]